MANRKLVGRWRASSLGRTAEYTFAANGTFTGSVEVPGRLIADFMGNWSVAQNVILYEYTRDAVGSIPARTKDCDKLLNATQDVFTIRAADGSQRRYVRVAD
ncbi:MAG: hypothetical protein H0X73_03910 [Chthoniobacterales bacterium]|nr:hypothetical protein [Chthoniobacterales bacterium]